MNFLCNFYRNLDIILLMDILAAQIMSFPKVVSVTHPEKNEL